MKISCDYKSNKAEMLIEAKHNLSTKHDNGNNLTKIINLQNDFNKM